MKNNHTYFANLNFRRDRRLVGIKHNDRFMHTYIIGKTGTGKSTLIETMLTQDIRTGNGCCLLDPHGDIVSRIANNLPSNRLKDLVYFNIPDRNLSLRYNPFKRVTAEKRSLVASGILDVFSKIWNDAWGARLEHILRHAILTLLDQPRATIADLPELLQNDEYRKAALAKVQNEHVRKFWKREYPNYGKGDLLPIMNKIGAMLVHPVIKRVLVENKHEVSFRKIMDEGKILLVNLSKGHLGSDVAQLLGSLIVTTLTSASLSRTETKERKRRSFFIFMDEFQDFTTLSLVNMFSELRKYKVGITVAHQFMYQLQDNIKRSVLGNVGTVISFRIGSEDAMFMAREMLPIFTVEDLINLSNHDIYLKLMINGKPSRPFSATTFKIKKP